MKRLFLFILLFVLSISQNNLEAQSQPAENTQDAEKREDSVKTGKGKTVPFTIGEIVVKQKRIANIENATTTTIVTAEDIVAHSDKDLSDSLKSVPGLQPYLMNKHTRFRMRGFEMPYVALLVDGIPISDVYEANIDISKISVMNVSEIIINRGTSSALYGTMGTVGSINIITKKPVDLYAKTEAEYGANGDYTLNMAQGNVTENFYYWMTATAAKQAPYNVSKKLDKSTRREWFEKFYGTPTGSYANGYQNELGYNVNTTNTAASTYLNDTGTWPHQESQKYVISLKTGYKIFDNLETGINANYTKSETKRYNTGLSNTESYGWNNTNHQYQWSASDPTLSLSSSAFNWRDVYSVNASPYAAYQMGNFDVKANVFYIFTYEYLDGYQDDDETTAISNWGGAHSQWNNTSSGFNIFPSYKLFSWNKINSSVLFRWDKHEEKQQADPQFANDAATGQRSYNFAGYDWFTTKLISAEQLTVALEDEISLNKAINIPVDISAGISYDAQNMDTYKSRANVGSGATGTYAANLTNSYQIKDDSTIWGTRDSFNPVAGLTYEPLKNFLLLRASYSQKTKLPTMAQCASVASESADVGLKPEKSVNTNAGFEILFLDRTVCLRADYFYSKFKDKLATLYDSSMPNYKYYTNIKGEDHQGIELISGNKFKGISGILDLGLNLSYTYLKVENLETRADSNINKGKKLADVPQHQVTADIRMDFVTKTSFNLFGNYQANAIKYAMRSNPANGSTTYSTSYYKEVKLHNPVMLNAKISQKIYEKYEAYVLCKNILDDYDADPFNPGPGRQFFFGLSAEI
jgi:outer membrane receptor protein involved in Fe transport